MIILIKINKYLYIHWLFIVLIVFGYINRQLEILLINFSVITVHELAHLLAAKCLGLSISHITIYPFGLNLKLKNTMLYSISDEVILYMAGPASNILMALFCILFIKINPIFYDLYYINIALFFINVIPITPLDGGMVVKKLLNYQFGFEKGNIIMKCISIIMLILLLAVCAKLIYINSFNPSICIFIAFIIGNILISREKYNKSLLKELLYCRDKKLGKRAYNAKIIGCDEKTKMLEVAKKFNQADNYFVIFTNEKKKVTKILSEDEIISALLSENSKNL